VANSKETTKPKERTDIFTRLQKIDERYVYMLTLLLVSLALLAPMGLPINVTDSTRKLYNSIEKLPAGGRVLIGSETLSGQWAEYGPVSTAILDHLFQKNVKIYFVTFQYSSSPVLIRDLVLPRIDNGKLYGKKYGVDYVDLGYIPGGETAMSRFGSGIRGTISTDFYGTSLDNIPVMKEVNKATDFQFMVCLGGSIVIQYVRQFPEKWKLPMGVGTLAMNFPEWMPYMATGQITGMLNGTVGGAEYEILLRKPGLGYGTVYADALSLVYIMLFAFIILGNVGYFYTKIRGRGS